MRVRAENEAEDKRVIKEKILRKQQREEEKQRAQATIEKLQKQQMRKEQGIPSKKEKPKKPAPNVKEFESEGDD
ncbi:hypothetical protein FGO68_gene17515 [Halteria grandinella]|uniref:Uncharacterized protein n=1 Tax=Halteria grandinella TaxID=5974 RepID=A0A8J8T3P3_HALGN|nr:hypothetical protein FGO68_gene17515 [Halteria grandinella]